MGRTLVLAGELSISLESNKVHIKHFLWRVAYLLFIKYICYVRLSVLAESVIKHSANFLFRSNVACTLSA